MRNDSDWELSLRSKMAVNVLLQSELCGNRIYLHHKYTKFERMKDY